MTSTPGTTLHVAAGMMFSSEGNTAIMTTVRLATSHPCYERILIRNGSKALTALVANLIICRACRRALGLHLLFAVVTFGHTLSFRCSRYQLPADWLLASSRPPLALQRALAAQANYFPLIACTTGSGLGTLNSAMKSSNDIRGMSLPPILKSLRLSSSSYTSRFGTSTIRNG